MATASSTASATAPSPEPRTIPTRGTSSVRSRMAATAAAASAAAITASLRQVGGAEAERQQLAERDGPPDALGPAEVHGHVGPGELGQALAAAAARGDELGVGHHGDLLDPPRARGDERADRARLRALALRVARVLDVGPDVQAAALVAQRGADARSASTGA